MQTRKLGYSDLNITNIGLGTWAIGGGGWKFAWGPQDDKESIAAIRKAIDIGINWIDTAALYGLGHSEIVVGKAIKEMKEKPVIATKCCRRWDERRRIFNSLKKDSIRSEVEASLKRLKIDIIDLYQIHWPIPENEIEEGWETIATLIKEGKIRYGGVSNFSVEQIKRIQSIHPIASLQPPYSMLERGIEDELLDYCEKNNIGVIVYSPMQRGLLTGKFSKERVLGLPNDDHRRKNIQFQEPQLSANLELVKSLRPIAEKNNITLAQLAIAWVLRRKEVTSAIVGARNQSQIQETAAAGDVKLTEDDIEVIEELLNR